ncbi:MAG: hypothetical protein IPP91_12950 [Betaproteobacteria bacterium]|nr:hypothetical protein [Betaproteobacteria bacterium]
MKTTFPPGDRDAAASASAYEVEALQVAELFRNLPVGAASAFFGTLLCMAVFMEDGLRDSHIAWFAYGVTVAVLRLGLCWLYRNSASLGLDLDTGTWAMFAVLGNLLAGVQWGLLGTWLFPEVPGYRQSFVMMVITCFVGGSITAYAAVRWAHPALSIPATFPATAYIFFFDSGVHYMAGFTALFFSAMVLYYALRETEQIAQRLRADVRVHRQLKNLESEVRTRSGGWYAPGGMTRRS